MFDGMFIVGITTPAGEATYHYDLKYWPIFAHCKTLEKAPKFDGHTPKDVLDRLFDMSLLYKGSTNQMCINVPATIKQNKIIEHSWEVNE